jgi:hypothetical protein
LVKQKVLLALFYYHYMFTWLPLDFLPQVPQNFIDLAATKFNLNNDDRSHVTPDSYKNRLIKTPTGTFTSRYQQATAMGPEWENWVRQNIVSDFLETALRISIGETTYHGAHCDPGHRWKLYYLIDKGGENVITTFYQEIGKSIDRSSDLCPELYNSISVNDYSNLVPIDQVCIPLHRWVVINTMIVHGVENQTIGQYRSNFTVSIRPDFNLLFENVGK